MCTKDELRELIHLLEIEKEEDFLQFRQMVLQTPLKTRKEQGVSWFPIAIVDEQIGLGGKLIIEIKRMANRDEPHIFSSGSVVSVFANIENRNHLPYITGIVTKVYENNLLICLHQEMLPSWVEKHSLGLDIAHDEKTFLEMRKALQSVINAKNNRTAELREILLGRVEAKFSATNISNHSDFLNTSQQKALEKVAGAKDVAIIHGPPGTGKTTTLVAAICATLKHEKQVLVCAPSNASIDLLGLKLLDCDLQVLRLGHPARAHSDLQRCTLDVKITQHSSYKQWKKLKKEAMELRAHALKFKRNFNAAKRQEREQQLAEAKQIFYQADNIEKFIFNDIFDKVEVIICTLTGASHQLLSKRRFSTVFIDEAAQGMEPACWIPALLGERIIFAGDHCQLAPTIKSRKASLGGLAITLMEKCIKRQKNADSMLRTQYRMNQNIMEFSNRWFYDGQLIAATTVRDQKFKEAPKNVEFIDTAGCDYRELLNEKTMSLSNPGEAELLTKHFKYLLGKLAKVEETITIAVIAPYKEQVYLLRRHLSCELPSNIKLAVNTVDSFQGQERDIIYISMVRSNVKCEIGFLNDIRRMNVAMTRARKKLIVVGDSATLGDHEFYHDFLEYIDEVEGYKSAWDIDNL